MDTPYQDPISAIKYLDFLNSTNGQIQQKVLLNAIRPKLGNNYLQIILDAACGSGWLAGALKKDYKHIEACDASDFLIKFAKVNHPGVNFKTATLNKPLPYEKNVFDVAVLNMAAPDLEDLGGALKNVADVIKSGGSLLMTVPNPIYTYPAAEWKRSWTDVLLGKKPTLRILSLVASGQKVQREFGASGKITSYYYTLPTYIEAAKKAGGDAQ